MGETMCLAYRNTIPPNAAAGLPRLALYSTYFGRINNAHYRLGKKN